MTDQALSQYVPIYTYDFADENAPPILPPASYTFGFPQGAEYFSEAQYLFNLSAAGEPSVPFTANQQLLSNAMIRYWTALRPTGSEPDGIADGRYSRRLRGASYRWSRLLP